MVEDLVLAVAVNGVIVYASNTAATVLGRAAHELAGCSLADLTHPDEVAPLTSSLLHIVRSALAGSSAVTGVPAAAAAAAQSPGRQEATDALSVRLVARFRRQLGAATAADALEYVPLDVHLRPLVFPAVPHGYAHEDASTAAAAALSGNGVVPRASVPLALLVARPMLVQPADALLEELLDLQLANVMLRDRLVHAYAKRHRPIGSLSVLREMLVDPARILHQAANDEDAMDVDAPPPTPFEDPPTDTDAEGNGNATLPSPTTAAAVSSSSNTAAHFLPTAGHGSGLAGVITPSDLVDANLMASRRQPVKMRRVPRKRPADGYVCMDCGTTSSPEWRRGPTGEKCLCNACGIRFAKRKKNDEDAGATTTTITPAGSPAVSASAAAAAVAAAGRARARTSAATRARSRGRSSARTRADAMPVTPTRASPAFTPAATAGSPLAAPTTTTAPFPLATAPPSTSAALSAPSSHAAIAAVWPTAPITTTSAVAPDTRDFQAALDDGAWTAMVAAAGASAMFAPFDEIPPPFSGAPPAVQSGLSADAARFAPTPPSSASATASRSTNGSSSHSSGTHHHHYHHHHHGNGTARTFSTATTGPPPPPPSLPPSPWTSASPWPSTDSPSTSSPEYVPPPAMAPVAPADSCFFATASERGASAGGSAAPALPLPPLPPLPAPADLPAWSAPIPSATALAQLLALASMSPAGSAAHMWAASAMSPSPQAEARARGAAAAADAARHGGGGYGEDGAGRGSAGRPGG
ncbi:hypothetical protein AMAG_15144 [Allomyces macrogynus ATCC 38327]|uniref:GATA-type domain-containing protein n=1 Tax=Allomyces macrogynus (strain ATCC 38327) TaxID=578462 RepID=A0A0L0T5Z4_ALLM3|nr:hypothetical protein AMAG_15144 [Allomyces macrogynus ATCC 38327]|eukprot:KNE70175.1 hypothetical protein AMAG_15144 [Allomyces macrogynus ATCC 38327]